MSGILGSKSKQLYNNRSGFSSTKLFSPWLFLFFSHGFIIWFFEILSESVAFSCHFWLYKRKNASLNWRFFLCNYFVHRVFQNLNINRLANMGIHPHIHTLLDIHCKNIGRHCNDRNSTGFRMMTLSYLLNEWSNRPFTGKSCKNNFYSILLPVLFSLIFQCNPECLWLIIRSVP